MTTRNIFFAIGLICICLFSAIRCIKSVNGGPRDTPKGSRIVFLIANTWGLISATSIDSLSSGVLHNYMGQPGDSLTAGYNVYNGPLVSSISLSRNNSTYVSAIDTIQLCGGGVPASDTMNIAYDTLVTSAPLGNGYSDTIFVEKLSATSFIYRVRYSDSLGTGVELDSFKSDRTY